MAFMFIAFGGHISFLLSGSEKSQIIVKLLYEAGLSDYDCS